MAGIKSSHPKFIMRLSGIFMLSLFIAACSSLPDFEGALNDAGIETIENSDHIMVSKENYSGDETMIFYPGGLVDPHSYLVWQYQLVRKRPSLRIITVKMPSNLAVFNAQKGAGLLEFYPETTKWIIAGHSLGGAMATNFTDKHREKIDALVYLAAYPADDRLKDFEHTILSVFASNDGLTTLEDIEKSKSFLPETRILGNPEDFPPDIQQKTLYYKIAGGNHAQFGSYGDQAGDLVATITREQQHEQIVRIINNLLERL